MAEEVYGLSKSDLEKLRALIQKVNGESGLNARGEEPRGFSQSPDSYAAYTTSGISARSGTTPGSGTAIIKKLNRSSGVLETVTNPNGVNYSFTVYSLYSSASGTNTYIHISRDMFGTWWFRNEDCP